MNEFTPSEQKQIDLGRLLDDAWATYREARGATADIICLMRLSSTAMELAMEITADHLDDCDCRLTMEPRVAETA